MYKERKLLPIGVECDFVLSLSVTLACSLVLSLGPLFKDVIVWDSGPCQLSSSQTPWASSGPPDTSDEAGSRADNNEEAADPRTDDKMC